MEVKAQRPRLVSMRVVQFHGENQVPANPPKAMQLSLGQDIQVGLGVSNNEQQRLLALVNIRLTAKAVPQVEGSINPEFLALTKASSNIPKACRKPMSQPGSRQSLISTCWWPRCCHWP